MKPYLDIDVRDPVRALDAMRELLERAEARSYAISTWIPQPQAPLPMLDVSYLSVTSPIEAGTTLRAARIIPSENFRISKYGAYVNIGIGLRTSGRFELVGREFKSSTHSLTAGTPFDLVTEDQPIRVGVGLVVRVTRSGLPTLWPTNASVESTIGYDPGA